MASVIYLVEGSWHDYEAESHWFVASLINLAEAEDLRERCQDWIDQYCKDFWDEFSRRFGEPEERRHYHIWTKPNQEKRRALGLSPQQGYDPELEGNDGYDLAQEWFGSWGRGPNGDEDQTVEPGLTKMRRLSPDPLIEVMEGQACRYRVLVVPLGSTLPVTRSLGPERNRQTFLEWFCHVNNVLISDVERDYRVDRCLCGHPECYGWKIDSRVAGVEFKPINQHLEIS